MAITKQLKVSFNLTVKISSEEEKAVDNMVLDVARYFGNKEGGDIGGLKEDMAREFLVQALTHGTEGACMFLIKQGLRDWLREDFPSEPKMKVSPPLISVVK